MQKKTGALVLVLRALAALETAGAQQRQSAAQIVNRYEAAAMLLSAGRRSPRQFQI